MNIRHIVNVLLCVLLATAVFARKDEGKVVDSGSFSVFINGQRVATEMFRIQQAPDRSVSTSEFRALDDSRAAQRSELTIAANGDLLRYEWRELSPGKAQAVVEPNEQFLLEHMVPNAPAKPLDKPFLIPHSTVVLDDYFFSHRQILIWRYLAQGCAGAPNCKLSKTPFGILVPRQASAGTVSVEYAGKETVSVRGKPMELDRFNLTSEGAGDWSLWLDINMKLVRIVIPADNTEIVRD